MHNSQIRELKRILLDLEDLMDEVSDADEWCKLSDIKSEIEKIINKK